MFLIDPYRFGRLWTPADITTALWLDASDASTITTVSGAVSEWRDKSGGGYHFSQATAARRPLLTTAGLNGLNTVTFDGVNDTLLAGDVLDDVWTGNGFDIHVVFKVNSFTQTSELLGKNASGADASRQFSFRVLLTGKLGLITFYTLGTSAYTFVNGSTGLVANTWGISSASYINTGTGTANTTQRISLWVNGNNEAEAVYDWAGTLGNIQNGTAQLALGTIAGTDGTLGQAPFGGQASEVLVMPAVQTTDIRQQVEGYLAHKWGLAGNLPAGHPYKSAAPTA